MFNETNATEPHLIDLLKNVCWTYKKSSDLARATTDIFLSKELHNRLASLNGFLYEQVDLIIIELQKICLQSEQVGLVTANDVFARWLRNEMTMPFGTNGQHVEVKLIDYEKIENNTFIVTNIQLYQRTLLNSLPQLCLCRYQQIDFLLPLFVFVNVPCVGVQFVDFGTVRQGINQQNVARICIFEQFFQIICRNRTYFV